MSDSESEEFNPYANNGGTVVAIAGDDFAVIGSDTRLSGNHIDTLHFDKYCIYTRTQPKLCKLSESIVLGCTGCWCDALALTKIIEIQMQMHFLEHQKTMSTPAVAQMISTTLYFRRLLPYYVSTILAGLDEQGRGCIYSFDPLGFMELLKFRACGSAGPILQPLLNNQLGYSNMENITPEPVTQERAVNILKDSFVNASERNIYTGDSVYLNVITKHGITTDTYQLRKD